MAWWWVSLERQWNALSLYLPYYAALVTVGCNNKNTIDWVPWTTEIYFSQLWELEVRGQGPAWPGGRWAHSFWLTGGCRLALSSQSGGREEESSLVMRALFSWPFYPQLPTSSNAIPLGVKVSTYEFGGGGGKQTVHTQAKELGFQLVGKTANRGGWPSI